MKQNILKIISNYAKTLIFPILMYAGFAILNLCVTGSTFFSSIITRNIILNAILNTIVAMAISIPLSQGRWDYACGTIATLGGIIGVQIGMALHLNVFLLALVCMLVCICLALFEAFIYITLRVSTMIMSLGVVMIYEALTNILFDGKGVNLFQADLAYSTAITKFYQLPWAFIVLIICMIIVYFILYKTRIGADVKSIGANSKLAINSGVNEKKNIIIVYIICGGLLGVAGLMNACNAQITASSNLSSTSLMFSSMGGVLIGLFLANYSNLPWGMFLGCLGMSIMSYGLSAMGIDSSLVTIITGVVIVTITAYTSNKAKIDEKFNKYFKKRVNQND